MAMPLFIYLHGFNSSPDSIKARQFQAAMAAAGRADDVLVPALSHWPAEAIAQAEALIRQHEGRDITLIGSSLGGYYSLWLGERYGVRAVLVNPAVRPYELLAEMLGQQSNLYTGEAYTLTEQHLQQMLAIDVPSLSQPQNYLLLTQTDDETLDYRQAVDKLTDSTMLIQQGGDHGFQQFDALIPAILAFSEGRVELPEVPGLPSVDS
ncbi:YqiA/YcfP family alpha/beta fold hydrolase [Aliamphritea spongicola]|uniref:YqiA/YcfP family alpha/beta fold hydrolase n=1 Tax=Aliamphritea spongicola TaxID=707589 RepID=UPI00196AFC10|nr:YqiA/YcfP family alpha/beta fold hydrolase [Aliamphritea spongicola]MBN3564681.1 esterase [Aliamphritea spongicola]